MVHRRLRYIVECTPRVKGNFPGSPIRACGFDGSDGSCVTTAPGPYRSSITYPERVTVSGSTAGLAGATGLVEAVGFVAVIGQFSWSTAF
jgi:hypothetical protein